MVADALGRNLDEAEAQIKQVEHAAVQLRILIRESVRFSERYPHYLEILHQLESRPPEQRDAEIELKRGRYLNLIAETSKALKLEGKPAVANPQFATLALLGMLHRIMIATPRPWPEDLPDWIEAQFLHGVTALPSRVNRFKFLK